MTDSPNPGRGTPPPPPVWNAVPPPVDRLAPRGYGGFWLRVVAYIIDGVIVGIPSAILGGLAGIATAQSDDFGVHTTTNLISVVISWLYFAFMESSESRATLGKKAVGLRVVTERGERLSFANATGRYFAKFVSGVLLMIGFIMVAFTDRKRGLHDIIAGTLVVKV
jgi:uncharacterized RDD family membrane protein YckC